MNKVRLWVILYMFMKNRTQFTKEIFCRKKLLLWDFSNVCTSAEQWHVMDFSTWSGDVSEAVDLQ